MSADTPAVPAAPSTLPELIESARIKHYSKSSGAWSRAQPIASDLDPDSCIRRQVLEIVKPEAKPALPPEVLERMEAGNRAEDDTVAFMERLGLRIVRRQEPFHLVHKKTGARVVSGKIDGVWLVDVPREAKVLIEAKLVETYMLDRITSVGDLASFWWMKKWVYQMQAYLVGLGLERGVFILTNTKRRRIIEVSIDFAQAERAWRYAEAIVDAVADYRIAERAGKTSLPPFSKDPLECQRCSFYGRACQPPIQLDPAGVIDDPGLEADIERWEKLQPDHREYEQLDKQIKERIKAGLPKTAGAIYRRFVGRYAIEITGKQVKAESKPRAARVDLVASIERLGS